MLNRLVHVSIIYNYMLIKLASYIRSSYALEQFLDSCLLNSILNNPYLPNKPVKGEASLLKYQVPLKILENHLGIKLLPQLNPEKVCTGI